MGGTPLDQAGLVGELGATFLEGVDGDRRARGIELARALVSEWAAEADPEPDPAAVLAFQCQDLEAATERVGGDPVDGLHAALLRRRIDRFGASTFQLASALLDGQVDEVDARRQAKDLLHVGEALADEAQELGSEPVSAELRRAAGDAVLDALYVMERGAMSPRLARSREAGPPDLRPA